VAERRVAPPAGVAGERVVGRAEVGGCHHDGGPRHARGGRRPAAAAGALELEARAAAQPAAEERRAQRRRLRAVALAVQVAVPARAACLLEEHHPLIGVRNNRSTTLVLTFKLLIKLDLAQMK
jgi:hypothetical protein